MSWLENIFLWGAGLKDYIQKFKFTELMGKSHFWALHVIRSMEKS